MAVLRERDDGAASFFLDPVKRFGRPPPFFSRV